MEPFATPLRSTLVLAATLIFLASASAAQVNAEKAEKADKTEKVEKAEKASASPADGAAACERAARQALSDQAPSAQYVSFDAAPALQQSLSSDSQVVLRGAGKHRNCGAVRSFSYSCNVDPRTAPEGFGSSVTPHLARSSRGSSAGRP